MASLGNIATNAQVGLLFVGLFQDVIGLHVNGHAAVVENDLMRATHPELPVEQAPGRRAERWVRLAVDEAYIHCSKHTPRLAPVPGPRAAIGGADYFGVRDTPR